MSLTTCAVRARVYKQDGTPDVGALVTATLNRFDVGDGFVGPSEVEAVVDADGVAILNLWPNELGATESTYKIRINGSHRTLNITATVPNVASMDLEDIAELPPYPGKKDGELAVEEAIEQAGIATTQAGIATTQAGIATAQAVIATTQAGVAVGSAAAAAESEAMALAARPTTSATPPANPLPNTEWIDEVTGRHYTWLAEDGVWAEMYAAQVVDNPARVSQLESALGAEGGAGKVGHGDSSVADALGALSLADYAELRAYDGKRKSVYVTGYLASAQPAGISGVFVRDDDDTNTTDNDGTVIVATNGKRWKRVYDGDISVEWFGADPWGVQNSRAALIKVVSAVRNTIIDNSGTVGVTSRSVNVRFGPGTFLVDGTVLTCGNINWIADGATIISNSNAPVFESGYYVGGTITSNAGLTDSAAIDNRLVGLKFINLTFSGVSHALKLRAVNEQSGTENCRFYNCGVAWDAVQCFFSTWSNYTIRGVKPGFESEYRATFGRATNRVTLQDGCITGNGEAVSKGMRIGEVGPFNTHGSASIVIRGGALENMTSGLELVGEMVDVTIQGVYAESVDRAFFDIDGALKTQINIIPGFSNSTTYYIDMSGLRASEIGELKDFSALADTKAKVRLRQDTIGNYGAVVHIPPDVDPSRYELSDGVVTRGIRTKQTTGNTKVILSQDRVVNAATDGLVPLHDRGWYGRVENFVIGSATGTVQNSAGTEMLVLCNYAFWHTSSIHFSLMITPSAGSGAGGTTPSPIHLHGTASGLFVENSVGTPGFSVAVSEDPTYHVFRLHLTGFGASNTDPAFAWMRNGQYVSEGIIKLT